MSYRIELEAKAADRLRAIPPELRGQVVDHLMTLASSPTEVSRPSAPPAELPDFQVYEFECRDDTGRHRFKLFFQYHADEQTLVIWTIGYVFRGA